MIKPVKQEYVEQNAVSEVTDWLSYKTVWTISTCNWYTKFIIKGVIFQRNCRGVSLGEYNKIILVLSSEFIM